MPRKRRSDFPGAWHHVMHRGARRAPIFKQDEHCQLFLDVLGEAAQRTGLEVHAYSLMPNHFHLLVRSPRGTLSRAMKHLLGAYTQRLNALQRWDGPLFRGRFKSQPVVSDEHLRHVMAYIHLNPVRAHLVPRPDAPCWTSYRAHLGLDPAPPWLERGAVRVWFGTAKAMGEWTRGLHMGRTQWPEDMAVEGDGWLAPSAAAPIPEPTPRAPVDIEATMARIASITGASAEELRTARRGRGAGPARRFAVRVLLERCALGHADAARALGTSTKTVANMVHRAKTAPASPEIAAWLARWDADAGHPGGEANEPRPAKAEVGTARAARVAAAKPKRGK